MIPNDGTSDDKGFGQKIRIAGGLVLLAVISYEMGLMHGRAEKSAGEYAAKRAILSFEIGIRTRFCAVLGDEESI